MDTTLINHSLYITWQTNIDKVVAYIVVMKKSNCNAENEEKPLRGEKNKIFNL